MESYYGRRRKSAGPCLQGSSSEKEICIPALDIPPTPTRPFASVLRLYTHRRVKSAREIRRDHETSRVFPPVDKRHPTPDWLKSRYSVEYCAKKLSSPARARPLSPTRMNNPHPSEGFLNWRFPSRTHQHKSAIPPSPQVWRYINQTFYEDCRDTSNTGDMGTSVPVTNLTKIEFPGKVTDAEKLPPTCGVDGRKAKLNPRHFPQHADRKKKEDEKSRMKLCPTHHPECVVMHHTIKTRYIPMLQEWLQVASTKEREVIMAMLRGSHDCSEECRLGKAIAEVARPESAEHIHNWLNGITPSERKLVLNVLENLEMATAKGDMCRNTYPASYPRLLYRSDQPRCHTSHPSLHGASCQRGGGHQCCAKRAHHGLTSAPVARLKPEMGLIGKKIPKPERQYDENPKLWHNHIMRDGHLPIVPRVGGLFHRPQRNMGQHFTIHPEWPTA